MRNRNSLSDSCGALFFSCVNLCAVRIFVCDLSAFDHQRYGCVKRFLFAFRCGIQCNTADVQQICDSHETSSLLFCNLFVDRCNFLPGCKVFRKSTCTSRCDSHMERMEVIFFFHVACHESGYHRIAAPTPLMSFPFGAGASNDLTGCGNENGSFACHGNQNVLCAFFLQLFCIRNN